MSGPPNATSAPSSIFILRHGARLDQSDSEWRLTSPTPYDPPLASKGISQAHQSGLAIKDSLASYSQRRVIIHTSPFLRCVQTAMTLASALNERILLRIDAWLGEWLTPDYYIDIDPPPPSRQLCASAIAGLAGRANGSVVVDWAWDYLSIGSGGEYGEEWATMHGRFSRGLERLLQFYQHDTSALGNRNGLAEWSASRQTVLILVTHGAGCNALLGALTKRPVLTDIPISSLSKAVLRPGTPSSDPKCMEYELVLQASTAHLPTLPQAMSANSFGSSASFLSRGSPPSPLRAPIIPDKRVIEYHSVRSRSASSVANMFSDSPIPSSYQPSPPTDRHPTLRIRTTSGLFGESARIDSPRTGLWTPTSASAASEDEDDELPAELGVVKKRNPGLWKSWAGERIQ